MPIPVPIPSGPLVITEDDSSAAESFVSAIGQIFANGTTGSVLATKPTIIPTGPGSPPQIIQITTAEQQLFYRQLGVAVVKALTSGLSEGSITIDVGNKFTGTCPSDSAVGDLVFVAGAAKAVDLADPADPYKMPTVGCIIEKMSATICVVQTHGIVSAVYTGMVPGRMYYVGIDSRPVDAPPMPGIGVTHYIQAIGIALDTTSLILSPSTSITQVNG